MRSHVETAGSSMADSTDRRCAFEPLEEIRYLFVDAFQLKRIEAGEKPAERAVFRKQHGVARGRLTVLQACPEAWKIGLWAGGPYDLWARWSSDAPPDTPDAKNNTLGLALKLFQVPGRTLAQDDPIAATADLLFQNSDIFFVDDAPTMCAISADGDGYLAGHVRSADILKEMAKPEGSVLGATFHSCHPYALEDTYAKFRLLPADAVTSTPGTAPNYLALDLRDRLRARGAAYVLQAQVYVDETVTPLDRAMDRWDERHAPFHDVARVEFAMQDIEAPGQAAFGESLAFSPWRTLHENRPVGSIADARRLAYPSSAALRRSLNKQPMQEPDSPG